MNIKTKIGTVFLVALIALIFFSKTIFTYHMPVITAGKPESGVLNKEAYSAGIVSYSKTLELYAEFSGKAEEILFNKGDFVPISRPIVTMSYDNSIEQSLAQLTISRDRIDLEIEEINAQITQINRYIKELGSISSSEQKKENARTIQDYNDRIQSCMRQLKAKDLDIKAIELQESSLNEELEKMNQNKEIYLPEGGVVISLEVKAGQRINAGQLIAVIAVAGEYKIDCNTSLDDSFISIGDICQISNSSQKMNAKVTGIELLDNAKKVTLLPESNNVSVGEIFQLHFQERGNTPSTLVPNSALNKDNMGYFIYQIKRRDGILGKEFYAEKLRVVIGDSDNQKTVILDGISFFDPIAIISDKPFFENESIKVKNESDFFEK